MKPPRITLRMVAEAAGVSRMAASLGLRGLPNISPSTAERIRSVAAELGYRADPLISRAMTRMRTARDDYQGAVIAFVTAWEQPFSEMRGFVPTRVLRGSTQRAEEFGYRIEEFCVGRGQMSEQRAAGIIRARGIEGVIFAPMPLDRDSLSEGVWRDFKAVTIGLSLRRPVLSRVLCDLSTCVGFGWKALFQEGFRRIALLLPAHTEARTCGNYTKGYLFHQLESKPANRLPPFIPKEITVRRLRNWIARHRPDAVLTAHGSHAREIIQASKGRLSEGSVAVLDVQPEDGGLRGTDQRTELQGALAVDALLAHIHRDNLGMHSVLRTISIPAVCSWHLNLSEKLHGESVNNGNENLSKS